MHNSAIEIRRWTGYECTERVHKYDQGPHGGDDIGRAERPDGSHRIIRLVRGISGTVDLRLDFRPRFEDSRIGYFINKVTDLTSTEAAPYRDVIARWHLEKKDPEAELSEPVEPITWWLENLKFLGANVI